MTEPEFDADGYPTEATLQALRDWPYADLTGALDFARRAWHWPEFASEDLKPGEPAIVHAEGDERFVRFATGGWSGNESIIAALNANPLLRVLCWRLSAIGGLHIYRYPKEE